MQGLLKGKDILSMLGFPIWDLAVSEFNTKLGYKVFIHLITIVCGTGIKFFSHLPTFMN